MTDESTPDESESVAFGATELGAPDGAPSRRHRAGRAMLWVAVGAVGATALTGVAFAASRTDSSTPSPSVNAPRPYAEGMNGNGPGGGPRGGPLGGRLEGMAGGLGGLRLGAAGGSLLHGDVVVQTKSGATKDLLVQRGTVTAATSTSLTVKSSDGFIATWTLDSSTVVSKLTTSTSGAKPTVSSLAVNDVVLVAGTKSTDTTGTALFVSVPPTKAELQKLLKNGAPGRMWMRRGPGPQGGAPGAPGAPGAATPTPTPTGTSA